MIILQLNILLNDFLMELAHTVKANKHLSSMLLTVYFCPQSSLFVDQ
jgi:hypothetical protein